MAADQMDLQFQGVEVYIIAKRAVHFVTPWQARYRLRAPPASLLAGTLYTSDPTPADLPTEVSGNGYARVQVTFGAPTAGIFTLEIDRGWQTGAISASAASETRLPAENCWV
jgi:hypothetical protein